LEMLRLYCKRGMENHLKTSELRLNTLKIVRQAECCGYEIHKKLEAQGVEVDIGRLYKVLTEMLTGGMLGCRWEKSSKGPDKRVYRLSENGRKELDRIFRDAIDTVHEYYSEYLLSLPSRTSVFEAFANMAAPEVGEQCKVAFFARNTSPIHEGILAAVHSRLPACEIYATHPTEVNLNRSLENLISLHGDYDSIPLREKYVDLLIIEGLPGSQGLSKAVAEWCRVMKEKARLVIIVPTAIFSEFKDPLSLGDFFEKMEHQTTGEVPGKGETLRRILQNHFREVEKKQMLQMTCLVAHGKARLQTN
jgi:DNA-binding PadR family transcriptional regulator